MPLDKIFELNRGQLAELKKAIDSNRSAAVFYVAENNRRHIAAMLHRPFVFVAGDPVAARSAADLLKEYCDGEVAFMPEREDVFINRKAENYGLLYERIDALYGLMTGKYRGIVMTAENLAQKYPSAERFSKNVLIIKKGVETDTEYLSLALVDMGYRRVSEVSSVGEFSLRGDVADIYPIGSGMPYRINFFGDEAETIRPYEIDTTTYGAETEELTILPATDILVFQDEVNGILNVARKEAKKLSSEARAKFEDAAEKFLMHPSSPLNNFFIPYIPDMKSALDYLPPEGAVIFDDVKQIEDKIRLIKNRAAQRVDAVKDSGELFASHKNAVADVEDVKTDGHVKLGFGRITSSINLFVPQEVFAIRANALPKFYDDMQSFFEQMRNLSASGASIVIACRDENAVAAMEDSLNREGIGCDIGENAGGISLQISRVSKGFIYPTEKIALIGINDLSRKTESAANLRAKRVVFELPEKGDYVVHEQHGIGISEGIQKVATSTGERDYYVVLYRDGDRLYLPCDKLDSLEKYNGADNPALHKLGSAEFERVKKRVKESVKKMAIDLLALYRSRFNKKGYKYQPDTVWQKEMEDDFPYTETDDQLAAIEDVKRDMEQGKVMDRLLCGDVGYGKTEVAIRAIFKTVIEGKQAAILAPTTILAQQHYNIISARFNKFKIKIDLLSRFVPPAEIKEALKRIESGETSVIVATHRILSKDVKFADLGLLVLDEEQRFGVEHKEKLKLYRESVNILSMSATPIPRTLHMALSGIRDISTLENPPKNRLPVETYVTEYSENLLKDAVNREVARGGQVFILYNRVQTIDKFYNRVRELLDPNISIVVAHGQMDEEILEDRIREFYENRAQVLISTTIIENGVDLPNANTLFVLNADMLGLSQAYQLRGRVGRSDVPAYAYFTVPEGKVLTTNAVQRLEALMDNTDLGSGFRIAMRDLEIRGAGNILGREQHGQMEKVGYEMYLKLVKEGIDEAQGIVSEEERDVEMKVDFPYDLPESYIPDSRAKVAFYKRISTITTKEEGQKYYDYVKKAYGTPPEGVRTIIRVAIMKNAAKKLGVAKLTVGKNNMGLNFYDSDVLTDEQLFIAMDRYKTYAVLAPADPPAVVFNPKLIPDNLKIKTMMEFLLLATK